MLRISSLHPNDCRSKQSVCKSDTVSASVSGLVPLVAGEILADSVLPTSGGCSDGAAVRALSLASIGVSVIPLPVVVSGFLGSSIFTLPLPFEETDPAPFCDLGAGTAGHQAVQLLQYRYWHLADIFQYRSGVPARAYPGRRRVGFVISWYNPTKLS